MNRNIKEICSFLAKTSDAEVIENLLSGIFTPAEIKDLDSRWQIIKQLQKGDTQRSIAKDLGVSLCKITRGSKELKKQNSILKLALSESGQ
ncbi:MAG: transcriptional regulator [Calditrichaeota bacterium]|nr:transcriptional regulator [Calditrichota bacterium]